MNLQFDHVIHYVDAPKEVQNDLNQQGFHCVYGGRHEQRGSYNTLLHFGLSYIEYLGIDDFEKFKEAGAQDVTYSPFSTIASDSFKEGFAKICIRTTHLEELAETFKAKGLNVNGPVPLSRRQPDGKLLEWSLLFVGDENSDLPLPFFIDWHQSDEQREQSLRNSGVIANNANQHLQIQQIDMAVRDVKETARNWSEWFELDLSDVEYDEDLHANVQTLHLPGVHVRFAEPVQDGKAKQVLSDRGERPFQLHLKGSDQEDQWLLHDGYYKFI
ncbi:VOC family protein [Alkalicoccobacillus porphyridii]|uniref:VOC family protein n=1 Tax=Alkalicoccobacillus porphyridii TaxID=2597270 RepID=A0A553ZTG6_9BACI|nr:VOC family protein [Alkalicoccobacillus porphyridii]TSB44771.1 VOC family protein [Alkalicoccobacillus porphyridii]